MSVAAIDIGTNSMRLLIVDDDGVEIHRQVGVTALGKGVDATGRFDTDRIDETLDLLADFGATIRRLDVGKVAAVATSASRDAANGQEFMVAVADRIDVIPQIIDGAREAALSFAGATAGRAGGISLVIDIGGGSTEFVVGDESPIEAVSVDMGSVRLTDRCLSMRPASAGDVAEAAALVDLAFSEVPRPAVADVIGVAGTFTSLAAMALGLDEYDRSAVDGTRLGLDVIESLVGRLAALTIQETARIPSLDPKRAPVILGGALIASRALKAVSAADVVVSESDLLDALAAELVGA